MRAINLHFKNIPKTMITRVMKRMSEMRCINVYSSWHEIVSFVDLTKSRLEYETEQNISHAGMGKDRSIEGFGASMWIAGKERL